MAKVAIVLFNLGGPDRLDSVEPFLFNLFNDPAIIGAPAPVRYLLAKLISKRRAPVAKAIYERIGGKSPLLEQTTDQARALEQALGDLAPDDEYQAFIAMRYWHPMTDQTVKDVKAWAPDRIVLLPLYPQFSTTTSGSSLALWAKRAKAAGLSVPSVEVCCYPTEPGLIGALADLIRSGLDQASAKGIPRILFSAHGLPKKVVASGDPYQAQVEMTAQCVVDALDVTGLDWVVCYQSRVGPLEWIGPSTEAELERAAQDKVPVVVVPIAFVSEHSETLVELDIEYRELADHMGIPAYVRIPALTVHPAFIEGLAKTVRQALGASASPMPQAGSCLCPAQATRCPCKEKSS